MLLEGQIENPPRSPLSVISGKAKDWVEISNPGAGGAGRPSEMHREIWGQPEVAASTRGKACAKEAAVRSYQPVALQENYKRAPEETEATIAQLPHRGLMPHDSCIHPIGRALSQSPGPWAQRWRVWDRSWLMEEEPDLKLLAKWGRAQTSTGYKSGAFMFKHMKLLNYWQDCSCSLKEWYGYRTPGSPDYGFEGVEGERTKLHVPSLHLPINLLSGT